MLVYINSDCFRSKYRNVCICGVVYIYICFLVLFIKDFGSSDIIEEL